MLLYLWVTEHVYFRHDFSVQACRLPNINYFDKSLSGAFWKMFPVICATWVAPVIKNTSGFLYFVENKSSVICNFTGIEADGNNEIKLSLTDRGKLPAKPKSDFVLVICSDKNGTFYRDLKYDVLPKSSEKHPSYKPVKETDEQLSILLFGLDSVSRLVAENKLPLTLKFFRETLQSYDFTGYTKVGDNTLPNLLAALNGQTLIEALTPTFDFPPLFKYLQEIGYISSYGEDWTPYLPHLGFQYPEYTHNLRTFFLAGNKYTPYLRSHTNKKDPKCFTNEFKHDIVINFADKFIRAYNDTLKMSFSWIDEIGHHQSNFLDAGDVATKLFFEKLHTEGKLNRTAVVLFSDHGPRYGKIVARDLVRFTGRLPMLHIVLPRHIRDKYLSLNKNMQTNTKRLITPFDLHETLKDILFQRFKSSSEEPVGSDLPRGISLFREVPASRSCYDAAISEHYCPCYTFSGVPVTDQGPVLAAQFMVDHINRLLVRFINNRLCAKLELKQIMSAKQQNNHEKSEKSQRFVVVFSVTPGNGVFEGTVEVSDKKGVELLGDINRLTEYKDEAACMEEQNTDIKPYCHCK